MNNSQNMSENEETKENIPSNENNCRKRELEESETVNNPKRQRIEVTNSSGSSDALEINETERESLESPDNDDDTSTELNDLNELVQAFAPNIPNPIEFPSSSPTSSLSSSLSDEIFPDRDLNEHDSLQVVESPSEEMHASSPEEIRASLSEPSPPDFSYLVGFINGLNSNESNVGDPFIQIWQDNREFLGWVPAQRNLWFRQQMETENRRRRALINSQFTQFRRRHPSLPILSLNALIQMNNIRRMITVNFDNESATSELIQNRTILYSYQEDGIANNSQNSCVICMSNFEIGQNVRRLPCIHIFHDRCVVSWLRINNKCPICRTTIDLVDATNSNPTNQNSNVN